MRELPADRWRRLDWLGPIFPLIAAALVGGFAWLFPFGLPAFVWLFPDSGASILWQLALKLVEVLVLFFAALSIHELAHCAAARALGMKCGVLRRPPVRKAREGMLYWLIDVDATLTSRKEWLITLAGPVSNLVCLVLGFVLVWFVNIDSGDVHVVLFAACNFSLAVTSLMPFRLEGAISDGERIFAICFEKRH